MCPPAIKNALSEADRARSGVTILLVEQNANMALQTAQYGYVMETGTVALHDSADNLIQNDYVRQVYLGAA